MRKTLLMVLLLGMTISMNAQRVDNAASKRAADPNVMVGKAMQKTGVITMSIGAPCVAAGVASLLYANFLPNPTDGYTTSKELASQDLSLRYMSASEYVSKLQDYNGKVRAAETAGYLLVGSGAALTIVGIPLYCYGKQLCTLNVNYTGNGAGVSVKF